ncbi:amidohydrolase (plasmid) [Leisingera sp. M527]|uniref:amidohydrolase n=1 Tax=Leisingera sp. M527 TaxID=2867014 RepID=UPI0021A81B88|nr:amidohydrolase [Leisingera sp. M527]UWQ35385.1 amidohydrolase [Leisingera sp. M527]
MSATDRFNQLLPEVTAWRRHLHANPEIMFDTVDTAGFVEELLRGFGCDQVVTGIGRTGVVGVVRGNGNDTAPTIGLRADMDALPIHEATGLDYASRNPGAMHACGHDGHMAMLLGAAKYLAGSRDFDGTAVFVFQPAEEQGGGGREMCEDGLMQNFGIDEIYGMHNWPGMPVGSFAIRPGAFFASTDLFDITIRGIGGHAAMPHKAIDSIHAASQIVVSLQSISSRRTNPVESVVVSVTSFEPSSATHNVIPEQVVLRGTVRCHSAEVRQKTEQWLREIVDCTARGFGARATVEFAYGYPVMVNSVEQTQYAAAIAGKVSGACAEAPPVMAAEDFAFMLNERPGAYILTGNDDTASLHDPAYDFNDEATAYGIAWWVNLVENRKTGNAGAGNS